MANRDPARPPRHWAPEAWRLCCAVYAACSRLPYASADARLLDGFHKWMLWTGKGQPIPGPWWTRCCALAGALARCLADVDSASLVAPWCHGEGAAPGEGGGFRPLGG